MKRAMGMLSGAWYFPGGSLEEHESPAEGARREIREETQLEVADLRLFRVWHYRAGESTAAVGITYTCSVPPGTEPRINEEHAAARWVTPAYYRDRFFNDEVLASLAGDAIALGIVTAVRAVLERYIERGP